MAKPLVAIVGRPNVGKSTFFNKMAGHRIAIVEDTPGVTRDRVYADCEWQNYKFTLIDTGGIDPLSDDPLLSQMRRQAEIAMDTADVICFFCDGRDGLTDDDRAMVDYLRAAGIPYFIIATKVDKLNATERKNNLAAIAADPALDEDTVIIPFSSLKNEGREDVLRQIGIMTGIRMSK